MKHNLFTITALSAAMLAGFAHAEDVTLPGASGSKTYTFNITGTIADTLSVDIIQNNQTLSDEIDVQYIIKNDTGYSNINGLHKRAALSAMMLKDASISSTGTNNGFNLKFINTQPISKDGVPCSQLGTQCGDIHDVVLHGKSNVQNFNLDGTSKELTVLDVRAGEVLNGFVVTHELSNGSSFGTGVYTEQWKLEITPRI